MEDKTVKRLSVRISRDNHRFLKQLAAKYDVTISELILKFIDSLIKEDK